MSTETSTSTSTTANYQAFWSKFNFELKHLRKQSTNKNSPYYMKKDMGFIWNPSGANFLQYTDAKTYETHQLLQSLALQNNGAHTLVEWIKSQPMLAKSMRIQTTETFLRTCTPEIVIKHICGHLNIRTPEEVSDEQKQFKVTTVHEIYPRIPKTYLGCGKYTSELRLLEYSKVLQSFRTDPIPLHILGTYDSMIKASALTITISLRELIHRNLWPNDFAWPLECPMRAPKATDCSICPHFKSKRCDYYNEYVELLTTPAVSEGTLL